MKQNEYTMKKEKDIKMPKKKQIPTFKSEDAEKKFWAREDSAEYIDWGKARHAIFPQLKPTLKSISLRLPEAMIEELKVLANKHDVPYQTLLKLYLSERIKEEITPALRK